MMCTGDRARRETNPLRIYAIVIHTPVEPQRRERNAGSLAAVIIIRILMGEVEMACAFDARMPWEFLYIYSVYSVSRPSFTFCLDTPFSLSDCVCDASLYSTPLYTRCAFKHIGDSK